MEDDEQGPSSWAACYRCHSQKLRCTQSTITSSCKRCIRAGVDCVPRPSRRTRQRNVSRIQSQLPRVPPLLVTPLQLMPLPLELGGTSSPPLTTAYAQGHTSKHNDHGASSPYWRRNSTTGPGGVLRSDGVSPDPEDTERILATSLESRRPLPTHPMQALDSGPMDDIEDFLTFGAGSSSGMDDHQCFGDASSDQSRSWTSSGLLHLSASAITGRDYNLLGSHVGVLGDSPLHTAPSKPDTCRNCAGGDAQIASTCRTQASADESRYPIETGMVAEDWLRKLAGLNSLLFDHGKAIAESAVSLRGMVSSLLSPRTWGEPGGAAPQLTNPATAGQSLPIDETFRLALQLLDLLDESHKLYPGYQSSVTHPTNSASTTERSYVHKEVGPGTEHDRKEEQNKYRPHSIYEDRASSLLLLSCYTRMMTTIGEFLDCIQFVLEHPQAGLPSYPSSGPVHPSAFLRSALPHIKLGSLSLDKSAPWLQVAMIIDAAEHLMTRIAFKLEITQSMGLEAVNVGRPNLAHAANYVPQAATGSVRLERGAFSARVDKIRAKLSVHGVG